MALGYTTENLDTMDYNMTQCDIWISTAKRGEVMQDHKTPTWSPNYVFWTMKWI